VESRPEDLELRVLCRDERTYIGAQVSLSGFGLMLHKDGSKMSLIVCCQSVLCRKNLIQC
jgi:hypothetical protein